MKKSWNSGKWQNHFPHLDKSWNLKKGQNHWKIMEFQNASWKNHGIFFFFFFFFLRFSCMLLLIFFWVVCAKLVIFILYRSWKNYGISFSELAGNPVGGSVSCYSFMLFSWDTAITDSSNKSPQKLSLRNDSLSSYNILPLVFIDLDMWSQSFQQDHHLQDTHVLDAINLVTSYRIVPPNR